jgi:hypothetical protein
VASSELERPLDRHVHGPAPEVGEHEVLAAAHPQPARVLVVVDAASPGPISRAEREQPRVEVAQALGLARARELRAPEGLGSCGSGTSSPANSAKPANSRRRPSRVAIAISSSMWSEKNWNGARLAVLLALNSIGVNGDSSVQSAASGRASTAAGRRTRGCRPGRGLVEDDEALGGTSSARAPKRRPRERE